MTARQQIITEALELLRAKGGYYSVDKATSEFNRRGRIEGALQRACDNIWFQQQPVVPRGTPRRDRPKQPAAWVRARDVGFTKWKFDQACAELNRMLK